MSPAAWAYVAGASGREATADANRAAFDRWWILPRILRRMLRDVSKRDLSIELFGDHYPSPVIAAPVGVLELVHRAPSSPSPALPPKEAHEPADRAEGHPASG